MSKIQNLCKKSYSVSYKNTSTHVDNIDEYDFRRKEVKIDKRKIVKYAIYLYNNTKPLVYNFTRQ